MNIKFNTQKLCLSILIGWTVLFIQCHSPKPTDLKVFKYNQSTGIGSLDPAFSKEIATMWACSHVYEGLFCLDSQAELQPLLIEQYWIEKDKINYHFKLKRGVFFHKNLCFKNDIQTREMNAYDVIYSLSRLIDPKVASPGAWVLRNKLDSVQTFELMDSFHLIIRLKRPNAQFLQALSMPYCSVVPKEAVQYYGNDFRKNPVGTGAFQFKLWDEGTALFFEKNKHYHLKDKSGQRLPYLDIIKITFNEQKKTELLSFEKGDLSFITGLDQSQIQEVFDENGQLNSTWKSKANISLKSFLNTEYMAILAKEDMLNPSSPLRSRDIRKAINYAIHRSDLVKYLKSNLVLPATKGFVSIGMPNYDTSFICNIYQPELAKTLVNQYTTKYGVKPQIELHINNNFVEMAEFISHELANVGISTDIKLHPADMMMQLATAGKLEFFRRSWMADYPDAENYLACFYSKNSCPPNYTRFSNANYDRLYEEITTESDPLIRRQKYKQMEAILLEEAPIVPIFYDQSLRIFQKNVHGLEQNVINTLDLKSVRIE